jgi:hypothetical protein
MRHAFNYPVTKNVVKQWDNARLANQVCFKVARIGEGQLVGVVYHLPCSTPEVVRGAQSLAELEHRTWKTVHGHLDASHLVDRLEKGDSR